MKLTLKNPLMRASAAVSTWLISSSAFAQNTTIADMSNQASSNIYATTNVISTMSYVVGAGFGMAGVMSLKKHVDTPSQEPIGKGIGRVAVGSALVALPFVMNTAFNSIGVNETQSVGVSGNSNRF